MTDRELILLTRIQEAIAQLEELHNDPRYCKGFNFGNCRTDDCWIWRLLTMLKAPLGGKDATGTKSHKA